MVDLCDGILFRHKKNEVRIRAPTWMDLENIMLSERSQSHNPTHCVTPLTESFRGGKLCKDGKQISSGQEPGRRGNGGYSLVGSGFLLRVKEYFQIT